MIGSIAFVLLSLLIALGFCFGIIRTLTTEQERERNRLRRRERVRQMLNSLQDKIVNTL